MPATDAGLVAIEETTDPEVLADLALGKMRKKIPALRDALQGRFGALHALLIGSILAHLDFLDEHISGLSEAIEEQIAPFAAARELLMSIPGVGRRTAEIVIAEIGVDMTCFPSAGHLASWAGQCPGNDQSAGKRRSGRTRNASVKALFAQRLRGLCAGQPGADDDDRPWSAHETSRSS